MTFYYFVNHIINDRTIDNLNKLVYFHNSFSQEIKTKRFNDNKNCVLSSEIEYIYNKLYKLFIDNKISFIIGYLDDEIINIELDYLVLVSKSYFLEEHPINLLKILVKKPLKYKNYINRILNYNIFDDFITLKSYINIDEKTFQLENNNKNYKENIIYKIFIIYKNNIKN